MSGKAIKEIKSLSKAELEAQMRETESKLFEAKMQKATGQLEKTSDLWKLRKQLARIKTVQTQQSTSSAKGK